MPKIETTRSLQSKRLRFLAQSMGVATGLLGLALAGLLFGKVALGMTGWTTGPSAAQVVQGCAGILFLILAIRGNVARLFLAFEADSDSRSKVFLFPLLIWPAFLLYRAQIDYPRALKAYVRQISEGSLVEWLTFLLLLAAAALLWRTAATGASRRLRLFLRGIAAGVFLLAMEEMSWGQIIFNWSTPEIMNEHNIQHETNLHNLSLFHAQTWIVAACVFSLLFVMALLGFALRRWQVIRSGSLADVLFPLGCTSSYFGIAALMYWGVVLEKMGTDLIYLHTREQEIAEFLFSVGVFIHVVYLYLCPPVTLPEEPAIPVESY